MRIAIVQARMGSTRLPGKSLMPIAGWPMLWQVLTRARAARGVEKVVLATTTQDRDTPLVELANSMEIAVSRGSEDDVQDRMYRAAQEYGATSVIRLTGDNPLTDPAIIDEVIGLFLCARADYASNVEPRTFPKGLDVEVVSLKALEIAWRLATERDDREHVTSYIRRRPQIFDQVNLASDQDRSMWRWTVDTEADLAWVRSVYAALGTRVFGLADMLAWPRPRGHHG